MVSGNSQFLKLSVTVRVSSDNPNDWSHNMKLTRLMILGAAMGLLVACVEAPATMDLAIENVTLVDAVNVTREGKTVIFRGWDGGGGRGSSRSPLSPATATARSSNAPSRRRGRTPGI